MSKFTDDVITNPLTVYAATALAVVVVLCIIYGPNMLLGMLLWATLAVDGILVGIAIVMALKRANRR